MRPLVVTPKVMSFGVVESRAGVNAQAALPTVACVLGRLHCHHIWLHRFGNVKVSDVANVRHLETVESARSPRLPNDPEF